MSDRIKVVMAGPIDTKGRYKGGIAYIINTLLKSDLVKESCLEMNAFDTCRIERDGYTAGGFSIENLKNSIYTFKDLREYLKKTNPSILYFNTSRGFALIKDLLILSKIRTRFQGKIILHIHFAEFEKIVPSNQIVKRLFLGLIKRTTDHIVLLSKKTRDQFVEMGIPKSKTSVVYNFHNLEYSEKQIRKKLERKLDTAKLIFLGSVDERKGIIDLVDAICLVGRKMELHICGTAKDKDIEDALKHRIANDIKDSIYLHGFVEGEEKKQLLLDADIMALPSYGEGFPIVLSEGLASGCMLITTNVGAISEVFSENNGRVLLPGDVQGIATAIEELCDQDARDTIIHNNLELAKQLSLSQYVRNIEKICIKVQDET